jgi:transitional endoplasmic reticulum ATPase
MTGGVLLVVAALAIAVLAVQLSATRRRADREAELRRFFASRHSAAVRGLPTPGPGSVGPHVDRGVRDLPGGGRLAFTTITDVSSTHDPRSFFASAVVPPAQRQLTARQHEGEGPFGVEPAVSLPTFADVGGMEAFKAEVRDTVGLILRNGDGADLYGITWNGLLLHGPPGVGKTFLARAVAGEFGLNLLHLSTGDLVEGVVGQSARNVERAFGAAADNRPCLLLFDEFDSVAQRREGGSHAEERRTVNQLLTSLERTRDHRDVIVVATTNDLGHLDPAVVRPGRFDRHVRVDLPDAAARRAILAGQLRRRPACAAVDLVDLARRTEGLTPAALTQAVDAAALAAFRQASESGQVVQITQDHLLAALQTRGGQDRPTVEDWDWDGLILPAAVKEELRELQALVEDPELADRFGVSAPSGVLLAGPPGTGKTTVARVLAAQARCSFYPVSAADVTSKWVGESERSIATLFNRARDNAPSIIFIDEIDAIGARRDGGAGESSNRQLNQLLQEMDGIRGNRGILVVAATNRPELLDPALVRGGRLSRTLTLELPDAAGRVAMLQLMTARMPTIDLDLHELAALTDGFSGADLKAVCEQAALRALVRARRTDTGDIEPAVVHDDFRSAVSDRLESMAATGAAR